MGRIQSFGTQNMGTFLGGTSRLSKGGQKSSGALLPQKKLLTSKIRKKVRTLIVKERYYVLLGRTKLCGFKVKSKKVYSSAFAAFEAVS